MNKWQTEHYEQKVKNYASKQLTLRLIKILQSG